MDILRFIPGYTTHIFEAGKEPELVLLVAFLITFVSVRVFTRAARKYRWGSGSVGGVHLHHLTPGIILILVAGLLSFTVNTSPGWRNFLALAFGVGAALTLDEFALWFYLDDVYWSEEGRTSVDAAILGLLLAAILLVTSSPFGLDAAKTAHESRTAAFAVIAFNALGALVCFLKRKLVLGSVGILIPLLAWVGALRLAKPGSPWAKIFYRSGEGQPAWRRWLYWRGEWRAERMEERYRSGRTVRLQNWILDLIGGAPTKTAGDDPPR